MYFKVNWLGTAQADLFDFRYILLCVCFIVDEIFIHQFRGGEI